ncbi:hypothetical protein VTO42DRAFT_8831 [Malbranchea cinnamomea]
MPLTRADFDNPEVDNTTNPSNFGYHHGPIPNNNSGWLPDRQQQARADNFPPVIAVENATAPNPPVFEAAECFCRSFHPFPIHILCPVLWLRSLFKTGVGGPATAEGVSGSQLGGARRKFAGARRSERKIHRRWQTYLAPLSVTPYMNF